MYKLYRLRRDGVTQADIIEAVRALTPREDAAYTSACEHLHDFEETRGLMDIVAENLGDVTEGIQSFESMIRQDERGALVQDPVPSRRLQRVVVNYLTATRLYLDHRRTHLSRRYGRRSPQLQAYEDARREAEAVPAFGFVWELRNFVQHSGMPLQVMRDAQRLVPYEGGEQVEFETLVGCRRSELISRARSPRDWARSRVFLEAQDEEFPILPPLRRTTDLLREIEKATVRAILPPLWNDGRTIVQLLSEATDTANAGLVAEIVSDQRGQPGAIKFKAPPFNILGWLQLIVPGDASVMYSINSRQLAQSSPPTLQ